jgi:hypothetical protein
MAVPPCRLMRPGRVGRRVCCQHAPLSAETPIGRGAYASSCSRGSDGGVAVHRDADLGVTEYLHDGPGEDALGKQERRAPMPQIMQPEPVQVGLPPRLIPAPVHVARLDRRPDGRSEYQPVLTPGIPQRQALGVLPFLVLLEEARPRDARRTRDVNKWRQTPAGTNEPGSMRTVFTRSPRGFHRPSIHAAWAGSHSQGSGRPEPWERGYTDANSHYIP